VRWRDGECDGSGTSERHAVIIVAGNCRIESKRKEEEILQSSRRREGFYTPRPGQGGALPPLSLSLRDPSRDIVNHSSILTGAVTVNNM